MLFEYEVIQMVLAEATGIPGEVPDELRKISALHVLDSLEVGGAQRVVLGLSSWLAAAGVDVTVLGPAGVLRDMLDPAVRVVETSGRPTMLEVLRAARDVQADVLHAHQRREALWCVSAGRILGVPAVEHAHTVLPGRDHLRMSFRSDLVFAVSPTVASMVVERFGATAGKVLVTPNLPAVDAAGPRADLSSSDGRPLRIVGVGRMVPQKDPIRFVAVIAALAQTREVEARWIGDGPLRASVADIAGRLGAPVALPGFVEDVAEQLDWADALVMTSRWEGSPLVALEAHARGRAVFATASSAIDVPDALRDTYVVPDDAAPIAFARRIAQALRVPHSIDEDLALIRAQLDSTRNVQTTYAPVLHAYRRFAAARS